MNERSNSILKLNQILKTDRVDFQIWAYEDDNLVLFGYRVGSEDFNTLDTVKIKFVEVSYISLPTFFSDAQFRMANDLEINRIKDTTKTFVILGGRAKAYCIEADPRIGDVPLTFFVVAEDLIITNNLISRSS